MNKKRFIGIDFSEFYDKGYQEIVIYVLKTGNVNDLNWVLEGACFGGHLEIVQLIIEKGAHDWQSGMYYACEGGHLEIAKYIIGQFHYQNWNRFYSIRELWNWGALGASYGGHAEIFKLMIKKGADRGYHDLGNACRDGYLEIVKLMIEKGINDWNYGLRYACVGGHLEIAKLMIEKGANCFNWGLFEACENGHLEVAKLMIEKGAKNIQECIQSKYTKPDIKQYLIQKSSV